MKLKPDAVRDILLFIEANQEFEQRDNKVIQDMKLKPFSCISICNELTPSRKYTYDEVSYAARQLCMSNYVISNIKSGMRWNLVRIDDLTWQGHEFLNSVRTKTMWDLTKRAGKKIDNISVNGLGVIANLLLEKSFDDPTKLQELADNIHQLF